MGQGASISTPPTGGGSNGASAASGGKSRKMTRRVTQVGVGVANGGGAGGVAGEDVVAPGMSGLANPGSTEAFDCAHQLVTRYCGYTKQGFSPYSKKPNQDSLLQFHDEVTDSLMFGALDGHGKDGHKVSQFITERLPEAIFGHPQYDTNPKQAISDAIAGVESRLLKQPHIDCELSGTTFVMGILRKDKLIVANIGDSRIIAGMKAVDGSGKTIAQAWSQDHKPESPLEKQRILAAGGRVFAITYDDGVEGPQRVWLGDIDLPGIAMSRSLGDTVAHTAGVSSEPEFSEYTISDEVECLIVASDGLWEFLSNQQVIDMWTAAQKDPAAAMKFMCDKSSQLWMAEEGVIDDTTILIANLSTAGGSAA